MASWGRGSDLGIALALLVGAGSAPAWAGGVSAYLPLNLEPEMERQIERVLILADEPVLKRPFAVELVQLALPQACKIDKPLCTPQFNRGEVNCVRIGNKGSVFIQRQSSMP